MLERYRLKTELAGAIEDAAVWNRVEWLGTVPNIRVVLERAGRASDDPRAVAAAVAELCRDEVLAEVAPGVWHHRMHETPRPALPAWLQRPSANDEVFPVRVAPQLPGVESLQYRVGAGLEFRIAGRAFGPYVLPEEGRGWLRMASWGCEGAGEDIDAAISGDQLVFRSERCGMPADEDEDVWTRFIIGQSGDLRFFCRDIELLMMWCIELHPLVAGCLLEQLGRCMRNAIADRTRRPDLAYGLEPAAVDAFVAIGRETLQGKAQAGDLLQQTRDQHERFDMLESWARQLGAAVAP